MRSNPEDAEYYRRFRDRGGAEQEASLGKSEPAASWNPMLLGVLYSSSPGSSLGSPRTLVKAAGLVAVCAILLGALWRGRSNKSAK
jgi:hypothetical protein